MSARGPVGFMGHLIYLFSKIEGVGGWESENRVKWEKSNVRRTDLGKHWQQVLGKDINNSSQAQGDYNVRGSWGY